MLSKHFMFKLGRMRKPQEWVVCPVSNNTDGSIYVQSDKSIGKFDPNTGKGVLNIKGCYFMHLNPFMGAEPFQFPPEFIELAKANGWTKGENIGPGVVLG